MEKIAEKSNEFEPTLLDVLEAVQTGFAKVEKQLNRHENILTTLHEGQENLKGLLNERTNNLDRRISNTQHRVEDVVDMLEKAEKTNGVFDFSLIQHTYDDK